MSNNKLVSIIIPAYNSQDCISRAINSVLNQTYKDIEIIIINDGSIDKTIDICKNYAKNHKNIKYISQDNKGVSSARNKGISLSTGYYICFLDSDDTYEPSFIEKLIEQVELNNSDFSYCSFNSLHKDQKLEASKAYQNSYNIILDFLNFDYFNICCLLIRNDFLKGKRITFDEKLPIGEDVLFILECICHGSYSYVPMHLYNYIYRNGSIMNKKWTTNDYLKEIEAWEKINTKLNELYNKKDKHDILKKTRAKKSSLQIQFMWKLLSSGMYKELNNYISKFSYEKDDLNLTKKPKKMKFRLKLILSKNRFIWSISRILLTHRKNTISD
ncbi:glycosyltransferase family 2 protein [Xenorhabdus thuongxuanensis]|uniref:Capsular polysaccharide biosynthesis protein CpsI n=1 Tax=Xenorhabdus thuongxuanensis TaxID=1873484 RepID=A0A1Q5U5W1_9GAMM|nr:glycosyltransferase family 2 protein [Xenorhabdus thuongxuanensis]OKP07848.1 capsular polysaccharide biosynthesis protein CpsI [Xenorhabdus thuongxuanensis]